MSWHELRIWAEMFNDAQQQRTATDNRAKRAGVDPGLYKPYLDTVIVAEKAAKRGLLLSYRRVVPKPIQEWQKNETGIGDHTLARLLGHLGHPCHATPHHWHEGASPDDHECPLGTNGKPLHCSGKRHLIADQPYERTIAQLWQYCGHGDPARRIKKGITADELAGLGKPQLKMIVFLLAEHAMMSGKGKEGATYREVYEARRLATIERVHAEPCKRCGKAGAEGAPWTDKHKMADALRITGKEILRDLWLMGKQS